MADGKEIRFEELGLASVLRQNLLRVPPNQREYSWTDKEVKQLFQDYAQALNEDGSYFLGTVVTIPSDDLEVVDGQQRLATTAILLAAIRDYLQGQGEDILVESITNEFLTGIDRKSRQRVAKLRLNVDDAEFFESLVTAGSDGVLPVAPRDSHKLMLIAYQEAQKQVRRIVSPLEESAHGDLLETWVTFLEKRALVVLLRVPTEADAYRMFETLNDRGLRTSQADLIKNYLFGRAGDRIGEVQSRWSYMRGALESSDEDDITINFLRHALIVQRGHTREADVYKRVRDIAKGEQSAVQFASVLENLATAYVATLNPEHERWNSYPRQVRRAIEVFNLFNVRPLRPLVLAIATKFDETETAAAFQFLISLAVRLIIASSTRSGSVEEPLANAANKVYEGDITTTPGIKAALADITPSDALFQQACATAKVSAARLARYYLRSLEMAAKDEDAPWFIPQDDQSVINLEHVLPRKPEGNWPNFTEDDVRTKATRLGNLALMRATNNSDLKSASFADKKPVYADSPYTLTAQIAEAEDWTPEMIDQRQGQLGELAVKAWPTQ